MDKTVRIWETETGQELHTLIGHKQKVAVCAISPDGHTIVSAGGEELILWDAFNGQMLQTLEGNTLLVKACEFSPDGQLIISANSQGITVWNTTTGLMLRTLKLKRPPSSAAWCAFSPDGSYIVSAQFQGLKIWDTESGSEVLTWKCLKKVKTCQYSPDGRTIITTYDNNNSIGVWEGATGQLLNTLEGHSGDVYACAYSPDGRSIVTASKDKSLRVWNAETHGSPTTREAHTFTVIECRFSSDGGFILTKGYKYLRVWDAKKGQMLRHMKKDQPDEGIQGLILPDWHSLVLAKEGNKLIVSEATSGRIMRTLESHTGKVRAGAISPDGRLIVSAGGWEMFLWNVANDHEPQVLKHGSGKRMTFSCAFSPDGGSIAFGDGLDLFLWDVETCQLLRTFEHRRASGSTITFSPDGRFIASTGSVYKELHVWDVSTGKVIFDLLGHTDTVRSCLFSPDGQFIISISKDRTLRVWDAVTGELIGVLSLVGPLRSFGLHPWKLQTACGDEGGVMYLFDSIGFDYGPIIVTAAKIGMKLELRCPACQQHFKIKKDSLGNEIRCPMQGCKTRLKVIPFFINPK